MVEYYLEIPLSITERAGSDCKGIMEAERQGILILGQL